MVSKGIKFESIKLGKEKEEMIFLIVFLGWMVFALWFTHWVLNEYPDVKNPRPRKNT